MFDDDLPTNPEDEKQFESIVASILDGLIKPVHVQQILVQARAQLIQDRAYMQYKFGSVNNSDAIAASAYSLAQIHLIDLILRSGQTHEL